jgi:3-hydroxyacyl-[acyl-carrier-protein] dehydratase
VNEPPMVYFMTIDGAKFRKPVVPGDRLEIHVRKQKQRGGIFRFACEAKVDGVKVAEADVSAMVSFPNAK